MSYQLAKIIHVASLIFQILFLSATPFPGRQPLAAVTIISLAVAIHFVGPTSDIPGDAQPYALLWPIVSHKFEDSKFHLVSPGIH